MATGLGVTPRDGWQHGYREFNGYRTEIAYYSDPIGWVPFSLYILDMVPGEYWLDEGTAPLADIRARAEYLMREARKHGLRTFGLRRIELPTYY